MNPLSIVSMAASGVKAVGGLIQGISGASRQRNLWNSRPQLGVTAGEKANDSLYTQMASATELPGENRYISKMDEAYSGGVYDAQQSATSSLGATQSAVDLAGKKISAVSDLAGAFAEYKQKAQQNLGQWNNQKSQNEMQRFETNQYNPWMMQYGEAVGQKQAGFANMTGGVDSGLGVLGDVQGTDSMMKILQQMGGNGFGINTGNNPFRNSSGGLQSKPIGSPYNPQQNLLSTLSGLTHK